MKFHKLHFLTAGIPLSSAQRSTLSGLERLHELGLDGVQLNWRHIGSIDRNRLPELRNLIEELGLYVEFDTPFFVLEHIKDMLHVCSILGSKVLRVHVSPPDQLSGTVLQDYVSGQLSKDLADAHTLIRKVLPLCAEFGVHIAVENHEYETAADVTRMVKMVGSEWVGMLVDTGNSMMVWEDPAEAVRAMAPYALTSHFKDHLVVMAGDEPQVAGVPLGKGSIDCAECLRILDEESPLERINIEVCYAYQVPFRIPQERGAGGILGEGAFRIADPPYDPAVVAPVPLPESAEERAQLLAWSDAAVVESVEYVKKLNSSLDRR